METIGTSSSAFPKSRPSGRGNSRRVGSRRRASETVRLGFKAYLNPEEPTFLGFLIMISLYKSLKR